MRRKLPSVDAKQVLRELKTAGWQISTADIAPRKPAGQRENFSDTPGIRMTALTPDQIISFSVDVRDWCKERRELEAAMLLKRIVSGMKIPA